MSNIQDKLLKILLLNISDSEKVKKIEEVYKTSSTLAPLEDRKEAFINELKPFVETYGKDMVNSFYHYWSATSTRGKLMAFEKEKSWNLPARLVKWKQNSQKFSIVGMLSSRANKKKTNE